MKIEKEHIDHIRSAFEKMQSKFEFLHLLNEAKPLVYGDKAVPFELKQLSWYSNPGLNKKRYTSFKIRKKSGADRTIYAPIAGLKALQKTLSFVLQCVFEPHNAAMGFIKGKSIVDNARLHKGSKYVYNIDLKDFFPSIDQARFWKCLQLKPFNLSIESKIEPDFMTWEDYSELIDLLGYEPIVFKQRKRRMYARSPLGTIYVAKGLDWKKDKYVLTGNKKLATKDGQSLEGTLWLVNHISNSGRIDLANTIAALCFTEMDVERKNEAGEWEVVKRNVLPQGAPTSPVITNIICQRLDYLLSGVAKRFGLKYSRYADDITFSSMHNVYQPESDFLKELHRIITEQGFHIKESKTRLQKEGHRQEVTGLLINEKVNVQKRYIKQLRMWLYYWESYGYERAYGFFIQQYLADKGNIVKGIPDMANVIGGKLDYLKMVKGADSELYLKLKGRFDTILGRDIKTDESIDESDKTDSEVLNLVTPILVSDNYIQDEAITEEDLVDFASWTNYDLIEPINIQDEAIPVGDLVDFASRTNYNLIEPINIQYNEYLEDVQLPDEAITSKNRHADKDSGKIKLNILKWTKVAFNKIFFKSKGKFEQISHSNVKYEDFLKEETNTINGQVKISLEVYNTPEKKEKLKNRIYIPKDTLLPSTLIIDNTRSGHSKVEDEQKQEWLFPHNPTYTISFLKKFKIGDGSGFKELVHDVILSDESVHDILNKVKSHPNFIYHFKKEWISNVSFLNRAIQKEVIKLIDIFENDGIQYYNNSHKHPFNNDKEYTNYAKQFKKKYRYGSGSEYSKLQSDIISIFNDQHVSISSLSFMPDERKFNIRASFFTWQPAIYNGIRYLIQGIYDHSNINGLRTFDPGDKKILIEVEKITGENVSIIELSILDCESISIIDSDTLLRFLQGSTAYKFDFRNLCDWLIECDFLEESSKRLNLLNAPEYSKSIQEIEDLPYIVGGFKHILRFYDVR